jgi:uncharacterized protein YpuA (DUF1002 family)
MDSEKLQQLQEEVKQEMLKALNNSQLNDVLQKYGLTSGGFVKVQCTLDLTQLQLSNADESQQAMELLQAIPDAQSIPVKLFSLCVPCPTTGNPLGCEC